MLNFENLDIANESHRRTVYNHVVRRTGPYIINRKFTVREDLTHGEIAYTLLGQKGATPILIDPLHPIIMDIVNKDGKTDKKLWYTVIRGLLFHEMLHSAYTDPSAIRPYWVKVQKENGCSNLLTDINNLVEDLIIEARAVNDLSTEELSALNRKSVLLWKQMPPIDETGDIPDQIVAALNCFEMFGPLPFGSRLSEEARNVYYDILPEFFETIYKTPEERAASVYNIYEKILPYVMDGAGYVPQTQTDAQGRTNYVKNLSEEDIENIRKSQSARESAVQATQQKSSSSKSEDGSDDEQSEAQTDAMEGSDSPETEQNNSDSSANGQDASSDGTENESADSKDSSSNNGDSSEASSDAASEAKNADDSQQSSGMNQKESDKSAEGNKDAGNSISDGADNEKTEADDSGNADSSDNNGESDNTADNGKNADESNSAGSESGSESGNTKNSGSDSECDPMAKSLNDMLKEIEEGELEDLDVSDKEEGEIQAETSGRDNYVSDENLNIKVETNGRDITKRFDNKRVVGCSERSKENYLELKNSNSSLISTFSRKIAEMIAIDEEKEFGRSGHFNLNRYKTRQNTSLRIFDHQYDSEKADARVLILVDASGSMSGTPMEQVKETLVVLTESLCRAGIPVKVISFTTNYDGVELNHYINFSKDPSERNALMSMCASGGTPLAEAFAYAVKDIERVRTAHRLLITITDGMPFDPDLAAKLIAEAKGKPNMKVIGVGICDEAACVEQLFKESFVLLTDMKRFTTDMITILKKEVSKW